MRAEFSLNENSFISVFIIFYNTYGSWVECEEASSEYAGKFQNRMKNLIANFFTNI